MSTNQQAAAVLNRAADRLEKPNAWTQGKMAKASYGAHVDARSSIACQWCSMGAIAAETRDNYEVYRAEKALAKVLGTPLLSQWNDRPERTQAEVVAAFRTAAKQVVA